MLKKEEFDRIREEILSWIPEKIVDSHVHTATHVGEIDPAKQKPHPLSYAIMHKRLLTVQKDAFKDIFPKKKVEMIGVPLPLPFANVSPKKYNNELLIQDMKRGIIGTLYGLNSVESLQESVDIAKKNKVQFKGIKFHPRMVPSKVKREVLVDDMVKEPTLEFCSKNKLTLLLEFSHGICKEDMASLKKMITSYDLKVVLPHLLHNHKGFTMNLETYQKTLTGDSEYYSSYFKPLGNYKNVYMDASMVIDKRMVEGALSVLGEDKIIYGTDYPFGFTPKIIDFRPSEKEVGDALRRIIDGKQVKDRWKFDYNVYLQAKALKDAEKNLNLDCAEKLMYSNAKKAYNF